MAKLIFALLVVILVCPAAWSQEFFVNGGATRDAKTGTSAGQWSVTYRQDLGEHAAFSFSYINEGHQPNHYRDGLAAQIWARAPILDQRLSLALGAGLLPTLIPRSRQCGMSMIMPTALGLSRAELQHGKG